MLENWAKWTWTEFYRDYILPTNQASKNTWIICEVTRKEVARVTQWMSSTDFIQFLELKISMSQNQKKSHACIWILHTLVTLLIYLTTKNIPLSASLFVLNIFINIYPVLVQINTQQRIDKILPNLKRRQSKSSTTLKSIHEASY